MQVQATVIAVDIAAAQRVVVRRTAHQAEVAVEDTRPAVDTKGAAEEEEGMKGAVADTVNLAEGEEEVAMVTEEDQAVGGRVEEAGVVAAATGGVVVDMGQSRAATQRLARGRTGVRFVPIYSLSLSKFCL